MMYEQLTAFTLGKVEHKKEFKMVAKVSSTSCRRRKEEEEEEEENKKNIYPPLAASAPPSPPFSPSKRLNTNTHSLHPSSS